jgi:hypothetical protein
MAAACAFCRRTPAGTYAVTALRGDPDDPAAWGRGTLPVCPRCHAALKQGAAEGRELKGKNERWFLGHGVGRIESKGALRLDGRQAE